MSVSIDGMVAALRILVFGAIELLVVLAVRRPGIMKVYELTLTHRFWGKDSCYLVEDPAEAT